MNTYLIDFLIGSSIIVSFGFYNFVYRKIKEKKLNINYFDYTLIMPIWIGFLNVLSGFIQKKFKFNDTQRYLVISLIGLTVLFYILLNYNIYNYTQKQFVKHFINVIITYLFIWIVLINFLQKIVYQKNITKNEKIVFIILSILFIFIYIYNKV